MCRCQALTIIVSVVVIWLLLLFSGACNLTGDISLLSPRLLIETLRGNSRVYKASFRSEVSLTIAEAHPNGSISGTKPAPLPRPQNRETVNSSGGQERDPCKGRYIYVYRLPSRFNDDMLKDCKTLSPWTDMCQFTSNRGLGPPLKNTDHVLSKKGWYATDQFALEVIFRNRMMQYSCLTKNPEYAAAIFVPFMAGLDITRHLWGNNVSVRDASALELMKWLRRRPEWKLMGGRDHFMVAGRVTWDFMRPTDEESDWGSKLLLLPETKNMTMLMIESSPWSGNEFSIPYPTYFHPSKDSEVHSWQRKMRGLARPWLFSFAGASRPSSTGSIRDMVIDQCSASSLCRLLSCGNGKDDCRSPTSVMKLFQRSVFCLQPSGDSFTRRSIFDSMLAGCIPVFFHPASAYVQYRWHLPNNYTSYSIFIPEDHFRQGRLRIEKVLSSVPQSTVKALREHVINSIPKFVYADPKYKLGKLQDAFDMAVNGVIERVRRLRMELRSRTFLPRQEKDAWKYDLDGRVQVHEWDRFFIDGAYAFT